MNISATARRGVLASASNTFRGARARSASSAASAAGAGIPAPGLDRAGHIAAGPIRPATRRRSATTEHHRRPRRRSQLYHRSESDSPGHARITAWNPLTRIGIYGSTPEGGVRVGYAGSSNGLEDLHGNPPPNQLPNLESTPAAPPPPIAGRTPWTYFRTR
jgi:hypothetical protein